MKLTRGIFVKALRNPDCSPAIGFKYRFRGESLLQDIYLIDGVAIDEEEKYPNPKAVNLTQFNRSLP